MFVSDVFFQKTGHRSLFNLTHIDNISSIVRNGILCYNSVKHLSHHTIAMNAVQNRREQITVPNGLKLHFYANLYFDYNNPMLYKRKDMAEEICVLAISASVLNHPECIVSDRNAAADLAKFYSALEGVNKLNFQKIFAQYWTHDNYYEQANHKAIKCAEVLIPTCVPYKYIVGAYVVNDLTKSILLKSGFAKKIVINPGVFYR